MNLQGDVTEIRSTSNALVAQYNYDAFGNILSIKDANGNNITSSTHIANVNPLRYRGYFYDTETGFYYLNSRYYDPATRRFISADNVIDGRNFNGLNMYSYCYNNPLKYIDASGNIVTEWDKNHLTDEELSQLESYTNTWLDPRAKGLMLTVVQTNAAILRKRYYMPYHYMDPSGYTYVDEELMAEFTAQAMQNYSSTDPDLSFIAVGAGISQLDSFAPGPADIIGGIVIAVGIIDLAFSGKSKPGDLERGMSKRQKGMFQREIEDFKKSNGMPPNHNLPWEILAALADEIKKMYK